MLGKTKKYIIWGMPFYNESIRKADFENSFIEAFIKWNSQKNTVAGSPVLSSFTGISEYLSVKGFPVRRWGEKAIDQLAAYLNTLGPDYKGFNRRYLYRMKQFYEAYAENIIVSPVLSQLSWCNKNFQYENPLHMERVASGRVRSLSMNND